MTREKKPTSQFVPIKNPQLSKEICKNLVMKSVGESVVGISRMGISIDVSVSGIGIRGSLEELMDAGVLVVSVLGIAIGIGSIAVVAGGGISGSFAVVVELVIGARVAVAVVGVPEGGVSCWLGCHAGHQAEGCSNNRFHFQCKLE